MVPPPINPVGERKENKLGGERGCARKQLTPQTKRHRKLFFLVFLLQVHVSGHDKIVS